MEDSEPSAGNSMTSLPHKLIFGILSRLPAKSLIRFQSVSKLWRSIILSSKDFADAFLAHSRTRPRLLFTSKNFIFSAPEHDKEETVVVAARHDMTISDDLGYYNFTSPPVNGLLCCTRGSEITVFNPTTGQRLIHKTNYGRVAHAHLGYDTVEDEYKVLCVMMFQRGGDLGQKHLVYTLKSSVEGWRCINETVEPYTDVQGGICMNSAIYYGVGHTKIAKFDLRYERMMFINAPKDKDITSWNFVNHQGKFGALEYDCLKHEMRVWIHQDKENSWSKMTCVVPCEWGDIKLRPSCIHTTGQVVLVPHRLESSKPFSVFYCDVIKESFRSAQVKGIAEYEFRHGIGKHDRDILCFPGYIENIMSL